MDHLTPVGRAVRVLAFATLAMLAVTGVATVQSQETESDLATRLTGSWTLSLSPERAQAVIDRAAEAATASLPPIVSGMTANELRMRNPLNRNISLEIGAERIVARYEHVTIDSRPGAPVTIEAPGDRSRTQVVQLLREGHLEQVFTTERGRRWTTFLPSDDGSTMMMESVVQSRMIPTEFRFQLEYARRE